LRIFDINLTKLFLLIIKKFMDKIHKFSPIIKQKFGLVFGGHYKIY